MSPTASRRSWTKCATCAVAAAAAAAARQQRRRRGLGSNGRPPQSPSHAPSCPCSASLLTLVICCVFLPLLTHLMSAHASVSVYPVTHLCNQLGCTITAPTIGAKASRVAEGAAPRQAERYRGRTSMAGSMAVATAKLYMGCQVLTAQQACLDIIMGCYGYCVGRGGQTPATVPRGRASAWC